ncbi:hypothetical protein CRG98_030976 [Punica granatum]|uniref:Uncharacterized protein n=1 Tax=Punica granatum TaxID=22663 RepID=A0A2I0IXD1_PUNGR|nr:hypothetical protein CRG98_030976 [Punica granatum]
MEEGGWLPDVGDHRLDMVAGSLRGCRHPRLGRDGLTPTTTAKTRSPATLLGRSLQASSRAPPLSSKAVLSEPDRTDRFNWSDRKSEDDEGLKDGLNVVNEDGDFLMNGVHLWLQEICGARGALFSWGIFGSVLLLASSCGALDYQDVVCAGMICLSYLLSLYANWIEGGSREDIQSSE